MKKLVLMFMVLVMTVCVQAQELKIGDALPTFELKSSVYGDVKPADLKGKVVLVSLFATWCGPCRTISPFLDKLSVKYKDQIDVYKIDVDKNRDLAQAFGATSIPLLIFVPVNGEPQANRGALPEAELENAIKTVLLKK